MVTQAVRTAVFASLLGLLAAAEQVAGQTTIRIQPEATSTAVGWYCSVDVVIDNASNLGAFQFDMLFSPGVVHANMATVGPFLGSTGRTVIPVGPQIDNTSMPARLTFGAATFGSSPGPSGSGVLATVVFEPKAVGSTALMLENVQVADVNGQTLPVAAIAWGRIVVSEPCLVTTTADSGVGSLRAALTYANSHPGPDTIRFNIPPTDPGCDSAGVCTIRPTSYLALGDSATVIDGYTQPGAIPNTNPFGAPINATLRIVLDGSLMANPYEPGLIVSGACNVIRGLVISRFFRGIEMIGSDTRENRIEGNFIGTDAGGSAAWGNRLVGVSLTGADNVLGGTTPEARNLISGNYLAGVEVGPTGGNRIQGNYIGTDASGWSPLGNILGIYIFNASQKNLIGGSDEGAANLIAFHQDAGVSIVGTAGQAWWNTISRNRIHSNGSQGIDLQQGGNQEIAAPVILSATRTQVTGTALPFATIEVFSDNDGQGAIYEGSVTADSSGHWVLGKPEGLVGPYVTATATDDGGNTSEFSLPLSTAVGNEGSISHLPRSFALGRAFPNPASVELVLPYEVPAPARISVVVYNALGAEVRRLVDAVPHAPGRHFIRWDGKDEAGAMMPSGIYVCRYYAVPAGGPAIADSRKVLLLR